MFYRVKRVKGRYYLVKEWYDPVTGKEAEQESRANRADREGAGVVRGVGFEPTQAYAIGS